MFDATALHGFVNTLTVRTQAMTAEAAKAALIETAVAARERVLHGTPKPDGYRQIVDGIEAAPLETVRPDGVIVFAWQYLRLVAEDTREALVRRSPRKTGAYIAGIIMLVDGQQAEPDAIGPATKEIHIVASVPYARRLEVGKRKGGGPFVVQVAPAIVEETAITARRLYGDLANFSFAYVDLSNAYRLRTAASRRRRRGVLITDVAYPAIRIIPRTT